MAYMVLIPETSSEHFFFCGDHFEHTPHSTSRSAISNQQSANQASQTTFQQPGRFLCSDIQLKETSLEAAPQANPLPPPSHRIGNNRGQFKFVLRQRRQNYATGGLRRAKVTGCYPDEPEPKRKTKQLKQLWSFQAQFPVWPNFSLLGTSGKSKV
ncbi:hypothetical protein ACMFMF_008950 [Clarireedia jacksonii]